MRKNYRLMIPGPIEVEPEVLARMSDPLTAHYGDRWVEIFNETVENIKQIMGTVGDVVLLVGSGHTANDTVINSLFTEGDRVLVFDNGIFGSRLVDIARGFRLKVTHVKKPWGVAFCAADVEAAVADHSDLKALLIVHGETSTGVANPIREIAEAAKAHGLMVVADTIASLGGEPYRMDEWGIDVTTCASQKALEAPAGLGIIGLNDRAWTAVDAKMDKRGWMGDLNVWRHHMTTLAEFHPHPGTMPVNTVNALRESTRLILEEGLDARWERHARIARIVREGARSMGLNVLADDETASRNLTVILSEGRFVPAELSAYMKETYGMHIGLGLWEWAEKAVRIGHMGPNANLEAMVPFLVGTEQFLRKTGIGVTRGSCLAGLD